MALVWMMRGWLGYEVECHPARAWDSGRGAKATVRVEGVEVATI